jgi:hypothetical protein
VGTDFDFWLGSWAVTDPATGACGTNTIRRVLGGRVIEERFAFPAPTGRAYRGISHTVHVDGRGWCQTWVDNQGLYLDFVGGPVGDQMVLERPAVVEGVASTQRMTWTTTGPDALAWEWARAPEGSDAWQTVWHLDYARSRG